MNSKERNSPSIFTVRMFDVSALNNTSKTGTYELKGRVPPF